MSSLIWVVDDDQDVREAMTEVLEELGYKTVPFETPQKIDGQPKPDIALVDWMWGRTGELIRKLHQDGVKVVLMTAARPKQIDGDLPVDGKIFKPFDLDVLLSTIDKFEKS